MDFKLDTKIKNETIKSKQNFNDPYELAIELSNKIQKKKRRQIDKIINKIASHVTIITNKNGQYSTTEAKKTLPFIPRGRLTFVNHPPSCQLSMTINGVPFKVLWVLLPRLYEEMINAITNANPNSRATF